MASLQQLKNRISGKSNNKENLDSKNKTIKDKNLSSDKRITTLEIEEARYLLALIAKTDFKGTDIQVVYNIAVKLQSIIKENLTEDNG